MPATTEKCIAWRIAARPLHEFRRRDAGKYGPRFIEKSTFRLGQRDIPADAVDEFYFMPALQRREMEIWSKPKMQMILDWWHFGSSTTGFFVRMLSIVGLDAYLLH